MKEKLENKFADFIKQYDQKKIMIDAKYHHSYRVAHLAEQIALFLKLSKEDVYLAYVIGLLHDIGRFKQITDYDSADDKYIDHGDLGAYILFEEGLIFDFYQKEEHFSVIEKAIKNHNKKTIEKGCHKREELFIKIIRDADKLDIFYLTAEAEVTFWKQGDEISSSVWQNFIVEKPIDYHDVETFADQFLLVLAFVYDLNFAFSFRYLQEKGFLQKIIAKYGRKYNFDVKFIENKLSAYLSRYSNVEKVT